MASTTASSSNGKSAPQPSSPRRVRFAPKASLKPPSRIDAKGVPEDKLDAHFDQLLKQVKAVAVALHQDEHVKAYHNGQKLNLCCDHEIEKAGEQIWKGLWKEGVLDLRKVEGERARAMEEAKKFRGEVERVREEGLGLLKVETQKSKDVEEAHASEVAELRDELERRKAEVAAAEEKFQKASLESGQLRVELSALKTSFAELRTENARVSAEVADIATRNSQLYAENTTYRLRGLAQGHGDVEMAIKVEGDE